MDLFDYWRLCDELTVTQAAHLVVGEIPPSSPVGSAEDFGDAAQHDAQVSQKLAATESAIAIALRSGKIDGAVIPKFRLVEVMEGADEYVETPVPNSLDPGRSRVNVDSLKEWLRSKGVKSSFFLPFSDGDAAYLDRAHPRYSAKLAAAVSAWQAWEETKGRTPKQAILAWLQVHAADFGLSGSAISDIATIVNWKPEGGAPKTPSR